MAIFNRAPTDWRDLQLLTAQLFEGVGCQVEVGKVVQLVRGQKEIDVWVWDNVTKPSSRFLVECKFWDKRVEQEVVHSFRTVVSDYGAHRGFIVSKVGFQSGAYEAAKGTNIDLLTFDELQDVFEDRWRQRRRSTDSIDTMVKQARLDRGDQTIAASERQQFSAEGGEEIALSPVAEQKSQECFVAQSSLGSFQLPNNLGKLDLSGLNSNFFDDAAKVMNAVAVLPDSTRSFYGHALAYSHAAPNDLDVYCIPFELEKHLNVSQAKLEPHFQLLATHDLLWMPEYKENWRIGPSFGWRAYFRQFDKEDNGIYFLWMIRKRFDGSRETIIDIFKNRNFRLLEI